MVQVIETLALSYVSPQFFNGSFHCFFLVDKRDEILCPTDLDWKDPFRDDWLRKTLGKLRSGINLTVIMDCCHSGTITRVINPLDAPRRQRYLPCPLEAVQPKAARDTSRTTEQGRAGVRERTILCMPIFKSCSSPAAAIHRHPPMPISAVRTTAH